MGAVSAMAVGALVVRDDALLMVREQWPEWDEPYWSLPGGIVEPGESVHDAMVREVREETGLVVVGSGRLVCLTQHDMPDLGLLTAFTFELDACEGELLPADPDGVVDEASWVPLDEATDRLARVPFAPMREPALHRLADRSGPPMLWFWRDGVDAEPVVQPIG